MAGRRRTPVAGPRAVWCPLVLAAAVVGCGPEPTGRAEAPPLVAARSTTFGDATGEGALSNVWGLAVSVSGHVFVSEPDFARVVEFDADGTFSRVVGARGDGPGEFRVPGALSWRGDSLTVSDFQRGIHLFGSDGAFATLVSFNINDGSSAFGVRPILLLEDGLVAAFAPSGSREITSGAVTRETWLRTSRDGTILDTLAVMSVEGRLFSVDVQGRQRSGAHPLAWDPILAFTPTGTSLVVVDRAPADPGAPASYVVRRVGLAGDTLATATVAYDPKPVPAEQLDSIALEMAERWAANGQATPAAIAAAIVDQIAWPATQPPVTAALAGADGSVWLRREMLGVASARWEILDRDLSRIGQVELPRDLDLKVVAADRAYGVELDDFDIPMIVRYDVAPLR